MLEVKNTEKSFGDPDVLKGVDLRANRGDVVAMLGPGGSGKTTLLGCMNFLERTDGGTRTFDGGRSFPAADGCTAEQQPSDRPDVGKGRGAGFRLFGQREWP